MNSLKIKDREVELSWESNIDEEKVKKAINAKIFLDWKDNFDFSLLDLKKKYISKA